MNVFEVFAKIGIDTSGYEDGLKEAGAETESIGGKIKSGLTGALKAGAAAFAAITAAAGALTGAFVSGVSETAAYGDSIDKMSQKMGISAEAYQEWDAVMQHSGTSMETLKSSMKTLANAAENGNKAFERLGITQEQIAEMSQEELFEAAISGLQQLDDVTERTYLSGQLLGRGATELGALLNTSAEDTQAMRDRVHELGGVMSDEAVKAAAQFQDNLQDMKTALSGAKRSVMTEFLPSLNELMDGFTRLAAGEDNAGEIISKGITDLTNTIQKTVANILDFVGKLLEENGGVIINSIMQLIDAAAKTIVNALPRIVSTVTEIITAAASEFPSIVQALADILPDVIKTITDSVPAIITAFFEIPRGLLEAFPSIVEALADSLPLIANAITDSLPIVVQSITDIINMITKLLPEMMPVLLPSVTNGVIKIITAVINVMAENGPQLVEATIGLILAAAQALIDNIPLILDSIGKIISAVGKTMIDSLPTLADNVGVMINGIIDKIKSYFNRIRQVGKELVSKIKEGFNSLKREFPKIMTEWGDSVLEAVSDIWEEIKDFWGSKYEEFMTIGGNLIIGIWNGIAEKWNELKSNIEEFGDTVVETFCDTFGISSPSKVMRDKVGKYLAEGIGVGFDNKMDSVLADIESSAGRISGIEISAPDIAPITVSRTPERIVKAAENTYETLKQVHQADRTAYPAVPQTINIYMTENDLQPLISLIVPRVDEQLGREMIFAEKSYAR